MVLRLGLVGVGGLGAVLAIYSTLGAPWHPAFVAGTMGAGLTYLVTPWRARRARLAAAALAALTSTCVTWVLVGLDDCSRSACRARSRLPDPGCTLGPFQESDLIFHLDPSTVVAARGLMRSAPIAR